MNTLTENDLRYVVTRLPKDIRQLLSENAGKLFVGGGFIRATVAAETPSDIDIFGSDKSFLNTIAELLKSRREGSKIHRTRNAITLLTPNRMPVQFITRWTFDTPEALVASFDFTICQAAIGRKGTEKNAPWLSVTGENFYIDLAGRRLVYTNPVREEEAGGSLLRAFKFVKRGYSIQVDSLGHVVGRLVTAMRASHLAEAEPGRVLSGLLREVDPLLVVDGFEVVDEHEPEPEDAE